MEYGVRVQNIRLKFAAAHMATFGGEMEPLHGHNYAVAIEVSGSLTEDSWVIDFGQLKKAGRAICDELDHKFLLQRDNRVIDILETEKDWRLRHAGRGFVFPKPDVLALPLDNTTAERLAEYIIQRLKPDLPATVTSITVSVEEAPGQSGWAREQL